MFHFLITLIFFFTLILYFNSFFKERIKSYTRFTNIQFSKKKKIYKNFTSRGLISLFYIIPFNKKHITFYFLTLSLVLNNGNVIYNFFNNLINFEVLSTSRNQHAYVYPKELNLISLSKLFIFKSTLKFQKKNITDVVLNASFLQKLTSFWPTRFNPTDLIKLELSACDLKIEFLRKNKIFNKSRYSRNRQLYRTGVYWCLWVSIFLGWALYFSFYRVTLNFSFLWWLNYAILTSFFYSKFVKYNLYSPYNCYIFVKTLFNMTFISAVNFSNNLKFLFNKSLRLFEKLNAFSKIWQSRDLFFWKLF